jgi:hypothetical protein
VDAVRDRHGSSIWHNSHPFWGFFSVVVAAKRDSVTPRTKHTLALHHPSNLAMDPRGDIAPAAGFGENKALLFCVRVCAGRCPSFERERRASENASGGAGVIPCRPSFEAKNATTTPLSLSCHHISHRSVVVILLQSIPTVTQQIHKIHIYP